MTQTLAVVLCCIVLLMPRAGLAYPVQGPGATSCAEFAKMYQADPSIEMIFFTWAQGYMSAINMSVLASDRLARELAGEAADQKRAFRSYCANNPLKNYMDGVLDLYGKLPFYRRN
ncbi:hypothetical protein ACKWRH_25420 [Bradyrhizobium sp. Pa8]|uniref:hypothetical protein n=1 Tax=Bradyrhizobium sp. Pa8 TaxID=3386552 RepID=UPI00403FB531